MRKEERTKQNKIYSRKNILLTDINSHMEGIKDRRGVGVECDGSEVEGRGMERCELKKNMYRNKYEQIRLLTVVNK